MRPRVLYFAVFVFYSFSGGRFTSIFLEHQLQFNAELISAIMAVQLLVSNLCKPWLGGLADSWEFSSEGARSNSGRLRVMSLGLLISTVAMMCHGLGGIYVAHWSERTDANNDDGDIATVESRMYLPLPLFLYHLILRIFFVVGTSACGLALDGLTLSQLEDKNNYGKERLYGALSWGIAHVFLGPVIDFFGFRALYGTTILSFVGCMIVIHNYDKASMTIQYAGVDNEIESAKSSDRSEALSDKPTANMTTKTTQPQNGNRFMCETNFVDNDVFADETATIRINTDTDQIQSPNLLDLARYLFKTVSLFKLSFILSIFALSIGMSVVESLIFLYFEFIGGSNIMCGLTVCVTVIFELPLFHYAPNFLEGLGTTTMMQLGCLAYIVRAIGYSFIPQQHPYLVLFLEPLHGVTIGFSATSSVAFADEWVQSGYESSGQGFMSMISGLGQFTGLCMGGFFEGRILYRVLAVIVALGSFTLGLGNYLTTKPHTRQGEVPLDLGLRPIDTIEMT